MPHPCFSLTENSARELVFRYITLTDKRAPANAPPLPARVELTQLITWIQESGFGTLELFEEVIKETAQWLSSPTGRSENFEKIIGARRDAHYEVIIAPNLMTAHLRVHPPKGGRLGSYEEAMIALENEKIIFGILNQGVEEAIKTNKPILVAQGVEPTPGKDTQFEPLVEVNRARNPRVNENGRVNWRDLGTMPSVNAGDPLMRRHPCEQGIDGTNVYGEAVSPPKVRDLPFGSRLFGVQISPEDPNLLVATEAGQPIMLFDGVNVEPIASFKEGINLQTGNVEFVGSVVVHGDIQSGMKVKVGGDLNVEGVIEAAEIEAGGNVIVSGGILGKAQQAGGENEVVARIQAKGNVQARYIDNAKILAGQSVIVKEAMTNSDVMAVDRVQIGRPGGRRGYILGGFVRATQGIFAEFIGGPGSSQTRVFAGVNPLIQEEMEAKKRFLAAKVKEHSDLAKLVKLMQQQIGPNANQPHVIANKQHLLEKAKHTMRIVTVEINQALAEERALAADIQMADVAEIEVSGGVFSGSRVAIGKRSLFISEDIEQSGKFKVQGGRLAFLDKNDKEVEIYMS